MCLQHISTSPGPRLSSHRQTYSTRLALAVDFAGPAPDPSAMSEVVLLSPGKREQTKLVNRQTILDAARAVFREIGFETATVRDIIRRTTAPFEVGAFYNYYRSKEEVIAALADDGARRFRPILHAEYLKATDFESYLRGAVRAYFEFIAAEDESWRNAVEGAAE